MTGRTRFRLIYIDTKTSLRFFHRDERLKGVPEPSVRRELTILSQLFEVSRKHDL